MVTGQQIRLSRILRRGKMLCIPIDHGISMGPTKGLEDPHKLISDCQGHGVTSIIANKGVIRSLPKPARMGILVHYSSSTSIAVAPDRKMLTGTVEEAVRLGADGVSIHVNIGGVEEPEMLEQLGIVSEQCHKWGMPLLAMMYPRGQNIKDPHDADTVAHVSRVGYECGADIVKTLYTGDPDSFARVVKGTPVPVVIAGGPKAETDRDILQMTKDVMDAGGAGVTYGRNIFAHPSPPKMCDALSAIIFKKESVEEAMRYLG